MNLRRDPRPGARRVTAALLAIAGLASPACGPRTPEARPDIVLVVIDTLRADHLPSYGYARETAPRIAKLAAEGVLFERVIAASSWTKTSMASLLTSRDPNRHGVRRDTDVLPETLATLAEALRQGGYRTLGINANPWLLDRYGFARGFDAYESPLWSDAASLAARALALHPLVPSTAVAVLILSGYRAQEPHLAALLS